MKKAWYIAFFTLFLIAACETPMDILEGMDHQVPVIEFDQDTIWAEAGSTVNTSVSIYDEGGVERIEFIYASWLINQSFNLEDEGSPETYSLSLEFDVPEDALTEWEEEKFFNDGSSIVITQHYHRLEVAAWDTSRNMGTGILYVRINE